VLDARGCEGPGDPSRVSGVNASPVIAENFPVETYIRRMEDVYPQLLELRTEKKAYAV
jgi:hypothetical protein